MLAAICEDTQGRIWFSTRNKVFYAAVNDGAAAIPRELLLDSKPYSCRHICQDKYHNLFFITTSGLYVYNGKYIYHLSKDNLLSDNNCRKLLIDPTDNGLWLATENGLNHLTYSVAGPTLRFRKKNVFFIDDGLPANDISDLLLDQGRLFIGTTKGICQLQQYNYRPAIMTIPVYPEAIRVNNRLWSPDSLNRLGHSQNNISFDFSAIYYQRRNRFLLSYQLIHNTADTVSDTLIGDRIQFISLDEGDYKLIVYGFDRDYPDIHSSRITIPFRIAPVFYKTWWFGSLGVLLLISGCCMAYYYHFKRQKEKLIIENRLSHLKLEALKAEMNPHFIFNSLNAIRDFIAKNDSEKSQYYLGQFAQLVRQALYNTKDDFVYLEDELKFIDTYVRLEQIRFSGNFEYTKTGSAAGLAAFEIPTMLLQPFIENAIRHGRIGQLDRKGLLELNIEGDKKALCITIRDNGIGICAAQALKTQALAAHRSMAMSIINERIGMYNKTHTVHIDYTIASLSDNEYQTEVTLNLKYP